MRPGIADNYQLNFQFPASPLMEEIVNFHNYILVFLAFISVGVTYLLIQLIIDWNKGTRYIAHKFLNHGVTLEIIWTITPAIILIFIAYPSFELIYLLDEVIDPAVTIKVVGHQWYWSYEYSDYASSDSESIRYDSYMIPDSELEVGQHRLLEVDNRLFVPVATHVRVVVTAADVIHSFAVPCLGVKIDAIPGRLNQLGIIAYRRGVFYGQCSEICGANHAFMPIVITACDAKDFCMYLNALK